MEKKLKVLFLHNTMPHYRIPVWNLLAEKCDLTIAYSEGNGVPKEFEGRCKFIPLHLPAWKFLSRVVLQKVRILKMASQYDVVLGTGNITWLKVASLPWIPWRKFSFVFWSLGVSASYTKGYDECKRWDWLRKLLYNKADACIFYTDYPVKKYTEMGIDPQKMFVAPNTVAVAENVPETRKDSLLFIGSLYSQKGLGELLEAYRDVVSMGKKLPILNILGAGAELESVKKYISDNGLNDCVFLRGAVYDINEKAKYFARAIACISPKQAGLAVQESLGYGVPFITHKNAITGGEVFDVKDGETGRYFSEEISLQEILENIADFPEKYIEMGQKAKAFYHACRKPEDMVNGAWDAIQYAYHAHRKTRLHASDKHAC